MSALSPSKLCERRPDQFCSWLAPSASIESGAYPAFRVGSRIPQRNQSSQSIISGGARGSGGCAGRLPEPIELVGEIENQALGFLAADAGNALQRRNVFFANRPNEPCSRERRQHSNCERGSHAVGCKQLLEQPLLEHTDESEQLPGIFLHYERSVQRHDFAHTWKRLIYAQRNLQLVGNSSARHHLDRI